MTVYYLMIDNSSSFLLCPKEKKTQENSLAAVNSVAHAIEYLYLFERNEKIMNSINNNNKITVFHPALY